MSIRPAKASDLDAITWISVAATPADPVCPYRYPMREEYPDDFDKFSRIRLGEYLTGAISGVGDFLVFEAPSIEDPDIKRVIAFSIWDLPRHDTKNKDQSSLESMPNQAIREDKRKSTFPCASYAEYFSKIDITHHHPPSHTSRTQSKTRRPPRTP